MAEAAIDNKKADQDVCPHCGVRSDGAHFCPQCGKIQPLGSGSDYFSFFGLARKLLVDESELEKSFYSLSRQFHPDYFMSGGEKEKQASIERSSMLNDAYRTLRNAVARVSYLLTLEGYKEAEKKAPPELLEEVFELNMQVEELKAAKKTGDAEEVLEARGSLEEALADLRKKMEVIDQRLFALFGDWDAAVDRSEGANEKRALLDRMSEYLSHRSYIRHLIRGIEEEI